MLLEDEEDAGSAPPQPHGRRWLRFGLAALVVGTVGLVGVTQLGLSLRAHKYSTLEGLHMLQDQIVSAVATIDASQVYKESTKIKWSEAGKGDPEAMGFEATMKISENPPNWPQVEKILQAKAGKGDELVDKLKEILAAILKDAPQKEADQLKTLVSIEKQGTDQAKVTVKLPKGHTNQEGMSQMEKDIKAANPKLSASMKMGRTIEQMFQNSTLDLLSVPDGILLTANSQFSSALFQVMGNMMGPRGPVPPPFYQTFSQLTGSSSDVSISYKPGASFPGVPTLEQAATSLKNMLHRSDFKDLPIKGIDTLLAGVSSIKVDGLPCDWEIKVDFTHFHPSPVLVSMIYDS